MTNRKTFHAIVLDMDGTLVNTERLWKIAEREFLTAHEREYDHVIHSAFLGLAVPDFIEAVRRGYNLEHLEPAYLEADLEERAHTILSQKTEAQPGTLELIDYITVNQIPCAIASNSSHKIIETTLNNQIWAKAIPLRYSAEDVARGKPAPDLYQHVANELRVDPQYCIAVEDSLNGIKAALAAGMTCYGVPDFEHVDVEAYRAVTPYVFETLHEVLDHIKQHFVFEQISD